MDPRNPKRPEGDAGANWAVCGCGRGAAKIRLIRHTKLCELNPHYRPPAWVTAGPCGSDGCKLRSGHGGPHEVAA